MTTTEKQFDFIIKNCLDIFSKKMKDYGSAWRILRLSSLTDQIFIKAQRIRSLQINKEKKIDEIKEKISIKTRQYAKRQSTWARGQMSNWNKISSKDLKKFLKKI